jgi:hypothetical protein
MSSNATPAVSATPREVASEITRAWLAYFVIVTVAGIVISLLVGGVYQWLAARFMGNSPWTMRFAFMAVSIAINAPISFLAFQWAVRGKVVPATLAWATGAFTSTEDPR